MRRVFLSTPRCVSAFREAVVAFPPASQSGVFTSVEYGVLNSPEDLDHGYTHACVCSSSSLENMDKPMQLLREILEAQSSQPVLDVEFSSTLGAMLPSGIRHLVLWRFDPSAWAGGDDPVGVAIRGYEALPAAMPEYFAHLQTARAASCAARHDDGTGGESAFAVDGHTVVLYSTFHGREQQRGFVKDERRKSFKAQFVSPFLAAGGCLVFDFTPGVC